MASDAHDIYEAMAAMDNLSQRSLVGGRRILPKMVTNFSERRLVRQISLSLGKESNSEASDVEAEDAAPTLGADSTLGTVAKVKLSVAPVHRKEIVLGRLLGQGSFSRVTEVHKFQWKNDLLLSSEDRAARQTLQKHGSYAVKHLERSLLSRPKQFYQATRELAKEAEYMTRLNHPNLLRARAIAYGGTGALGSGRYNDFFIISDRLVDTLDERIDKWRKSCSPGLATKLQYAIQLASALEYLHSKRLIFRDVKPSNCGITSEGSLVLFDYGFCRELPPSQGGDLEREAFRLSIAGSYRYMAPEIMIGRPYNCKADVYSFSLVLYELLTEEKSYTNIQTSQHRFIREVAELQTRPDTSGHKLIKPLKDLLQESWSRDESMRPTMRTCLDRLHPMQHAHQVPVVSKQPRLCRSTTTGSTTTSSGRSSATASVPPFSNKSTLQSHGRAKSLPVIITPRDSVDC